MIKLKELALHRKFLLLLFTFNLIGTLFGFAWYKGQLAHTLWYFTPFVPDSPLSALFFTIALSLYLWGHNRYPRAQAIISALATTWLIKYGVWCDYTLLYEWVGSKWLPMEAWVLILSHAGMVFEAVLYSLFVRILRFSFGQLLFASLTLVINDYADYVYGVYPYLPNSSMLPMMTVLTPILSIIAIVIAYPVLNPRSHV